MFKILKKLIILTTAAFIITGCSQNKTDTTTVAPMSLEDYQTAIETNIDEIKTITNDSDTSTVEGISDLISKIEPLYKKMSALNPPESLSEAHDKLKSSCDASIEILTMSKEVLEALDNPTATDVQKAEDLNTKISELQGKQQDMQDALNEIFGAVETGATTETGQE